MVFPHCATKVSRRRETERHERIHEMDFNLAAFREDRGELKRDVVNLIEHFRDEATNRVQTPPPK